MTVRSPSIAAPPLWQYEHPQSTGAASNWQNVLAAASSALGESSSTVQQQLQSGSSLSWIASSQGVSQQTLVSAIAGALQQNAGTRQAGNQTRRAARSCSRSPRTSPTAAAATTTITIAAAGDSHQVEHRRRTAATRRLGPRGPTAPHPSRDGVPRRPQRDQHVIRRQHRVGDRGPPGRTGRGMNRRPRAARPRGAPRRCWPPSAARARPRRAVARRLTPARCCRPYSAAKFG